MLSKPHAPGTPSAREKTVPGLTLAIPSEAIDAIASRAAEIVLDRDEEKASPWLTRKEAAKEAKLRCKLSVQRHHAG